MRLTVAVLALLWAAPVALADDPPAKQPPAQEALKAGLDKAKAEGKVVFLVFGSPGCGWCKVFDKYHQESDVRRVLEQRYVFVKVDVADSPGGNEMYKKYTKGQGAGVPFWVVLDPAEKVLIDADDGTKGNVGFPFEPHEIAHYVKALKETYPGLTDEQREFAGQEAQGRGPEEELRLSHRGHRGHREKTEEDFFPFCLLSVSSVAKSSASRHADDCGDAAAQPTVPHC
jgi:hypothetical protein